MAKRKKTRQQKIIADLRKQLLKDTLSSQTDRTISLDNFKNENNKLQESSLKVVKKTELSKNYNYLIHDLKKTAILTSSIIALQIALYLALTNRLLVLPGLTY